MAIEIRLASLEANCRRVLRRTSREAEPQDPWSLRAGNEQNVRPAFLDVACGAAAGESAKPASLAKLTQHLFSGRGYIYEYFKGDSCVTNGKIFYMTEYLFNEERTSITHLPRPVNCRDQALGLAFLARAVGIEVGVCVAKTFNRHLYMKPGLLVGFSQETDNPFYRSTVERYCRNRLCGSEAHADEIERSYFTEHVYGLYDGRVYDACIGPRLGTDTEQTYLADCFEPGQDIHASSLGVNYVVE